MDEKPDPLWDPDLPGDEVLKQLESTLGSFRHEPGTDRVWPRVPATARVRRRYLAIRAIAAVFAVCVIGAAGWLPWRLMWADGKPWQIESISGTANELLNIGQIVETPAAQSMQIRIARIGNMEVMPGSRIQLLETRKGHHRIELLDGRLHARVWAPPGYFGINSGSSETIDLGCEFDMNKTPTGEGSISVTSGWVMHSVNGQETLVPEGFTLAFNAMRSGIPMPESVSAEVRSAIIQLDLDLSQKKRDTRIEALLASTATRSDRFALLTLLTRYPALASGPLYPALGGMFDTAAVDPNHRKAWANGSVHAMNAWWEKVPRPPKAWWLNWKDAL